MVLKGMGIIILAFAISFVGSYLVIKIVPFFKTDEPIAIAVLSATVITALYVYSTDIVYKKILSPEEYEERVREAEQQRRNAAQAEQIRDDLYISQLPIDDPQRLIYNQMKRNNGQGGTNQTVDDLYISKLPIDDPQRILYNQLKRNNKK